MYKALVSFCGIVTMAKGEIRNIPEHIAQDLLNAHYIEKVEKEKKAEKKPEKKKSTKKKSTKKTPKGEKK